MSLTDVTINNPDTTTSLYLQSVSLKTDRLVVNKNRGTAEQGGGIKCIDCVNIDIAHSHFNFLEAQRGGAIFIVQSDTAKLNDPTVISYNITSSEFRGN